MSAAVETRPATAADVKRLDTLKAQFALRGHSVFAIEDGAFLVTRHGLCKHCPSIEALDAFAQQVGAVR